jgi:uncharacterized protein YprB with RNaseH-like and TPR domain
LITEALMHCPGIGPARLAQLHGLGIRNWSDAVERADQVPPSFCGPLLDECGRCLAALRERDVRFFVDRLAPQDKWRILSEFLDQTSFFDIETTGLEYDAQITVIVCWHRQQLHTFVEHENLDDFLDLLDDVTLLASFNGSSFDAPRVLDAFHIPQLPCPHLDLRWPCYHQGLRGTLKDIAQRSGISRPNDLSDADGALAVQLWNRWILRQDHAAREHLLRYCAADVLMLVMLARQLAKLETAAPSDLWTHLPDAGPTPATQAAASHRPPVLDNRFGQANPAKLRARRSLV